MNKNGCQCNIRHLELIDNRASNLMEDSKVGVKNLETGIELTFFGWKRIIHFRCDMMQIFLDGFEFLSSHNRMVCK